MSTEETTKRAVNEFSDAEDLRPTVAMLIDRHKIKFGHVRSDSVVLRRRFGDKEVKWIARISLVPPRFKDMFPDKSIYVMEVDSDQFDGLEPLQKEAVVFHELLHTMLTEKGKYKLRDHDVKEFAEVIEEYGGYLPDVVRTINAVNRNLERGPKRDTVEDLVGDDEDLETNED